MMSETKNIIISISTKQKVEENFIEYDLPLIFFLSPQDEKI